MRKMKSGSHIITFQTIHELAKFASCTRCESGEDSTSWNANKLEFYHFELLNNHWMCKNKECQEQNGLENDRCSKCGKKRGSAR